MKYEQTKHKIKKLWELTYKNQNNLKEKKSEDIKLLNIISSFKRIIILYDSDLTQITVSPIQGGEFITTAWG